MGICLRLARSTVRQGLVTDFVSVVANLLPDSILIIVTRLGRFADGCAVHAISHGILDNVERLEKRVAFLNKAARVALIKEVHLKCG